MEPNAQFSGVVAYPTTEQIAPLAGPVRQIDNKSQFGDNDAQDVSVARKSEIAKFIWSIAPATE
jgi:hypothetical protein